jgi:hypothetical protein
MSPIGFCRNCPTHSRCVAICAKLEAELAKYERARSDYHSIDDKLTNSAEGSKENGLLLVDKIVGLDFIRDYFKDDTFVKGPKLSSATIPDLQTSKIPQSYILNRKFIDQLFYRKSDSKNRGYFTTFLKCRSIANIAQLAGCSKQMMHKKVAGWVKQLFMILLKRQNIDVTRLMTPKKFKDSTI